MWDGSGRVAAEATLTEPIAVNQCLRIIAEEDGAIPTLTAPCGNTPWPKLGQAGGCVLRLLVVGFGLMLSRLTTSEKGSLYLREMKNLIVQ